jgi:hypothetical protein
MNVNHFGVCKDETKNDFIGTYSDVHITVSQNIDPDEVPSNLPLQTTANSYSSTLRSDEKMNFCESKSREYEELLTDFTKAQPNPKMNFSGQSVDNLEAIEKTNLYIFRIGEFLVTKCKEINRFGRGAAETKDEFLVTKCKEIETSMSVRKTEEDGKFSDMERKKIDNYGKDNSEAKNEIIETKCKEIDFSDILFCEEYVKRKKIILDGESKEYIVEVGGEKLVLTSICMPGILFILAYKYNIFNLYFTIITTIGCIASVLFWINPVKNKDTQIHKLDGLFARFVIANYTFYKLVINRNNLFIFLCNYAPMMYYFYLSNKYSSKKWCSVSHINAHVTAHLYCMLCLYISFFQRDFLWEFIYGLNNSSVKYVNSPS